METKNYRDEEVIYQMMAIDTKDETRFKPIRNDQERNYNMLISSLQLDSEAKAYLEGKGRPTWAFNLLTPVIRNLSSIERGSRKKLIAKPKSGGDVERANLITQVMDWHLTNAKYDIRRSRSFLDAIIARYGCRYMNWSYKNDPLGSLYISSRNPMRIKFDMGSFMDADMSNMQYIYEKADLSIEEIINRYARNDIELQELIIEAAKPYFVEEIAKKNSFISTVLKKMMSAVSDYFIGYGSDSYNQMLRGNEGEWMNKQNMTFTVIDMHDRRTERRMFHYNDRSMRYEDITDLVINKKSEMFDRDKIQFYRETGRLNNEPRVELHEVNWITTVCPLLNLKLQDIAYPIRTKNFLYVLNFAYDFHADMSQAQSVIDELVDPQSAYNKNRSTMAEMLTKIVNSGTVVIPQAIQGYEEDWTEPEIGQIKRIKDLNAYKKEDIGHVPQELIHEGERYKNDIEYISNVAMSVRGMSESKNEPGILFMAKRDQNLQTLQHLFDNLNQSNIQDGENAVAFIQEFDTEERVIRLTQDEGGEESVIIINEKVPIIKDHKLIFEILNDVTVGRYDIEISSTPHGQTAKEMEFVKISEIVTFASKLEPATALRMLPVMIEASDSSYRGKLLEAINGTPEEENARAQLQAQMQQLQQIMTQLGIEEKQLENAKKEQEVEGEALNNELKKKQIQEKSQQNFLSGLLTHQNKFTTDNKKKKDYANA